MERKYKLLIVDDDKDILTKYENYIVKQGFIVEVAHDGTEGLEKLRRDSEFDIALVDFKMPDMNGVDMIRQAYKVGIAADMIIWSEPEEYSKYDAVAAMKLGVNDWFEKSRLDMPKFFQRIKEVAEGVSLNEVSRILSLIPKEEFESFGKSAERSSRNN
jgi:DNA-binding NtrC family response regulator